MNWYRSKENEEWINLDSFWCIEIVHERVVGHLHNGQDYCFFHDPTTKKLKTFLKELPLRKSQ